MPSEQMEFTQNLVFNVGVIAYEYKYAGRVQYQRLAFRGIGKLAMANRDDELRRRRVPDVVPSAAELSTKAASKVGLWIGMRPSTLHASDSPQSRGGESVNDYSGYRPILHDPKALRVIALIGSAGMYTKHYCLADEKDGLCKAYHIPLQDVFFFSEYRDDRLRDKDRRKVEWSRRAREACKARSITRSCTLQAEESEDEDELENEDANDNPTSKTPVKVRIEAVEAEVATQPEHYKMLHKLASGTEVLSIEECGVAIQQFRVFAPDLNSKDYKPEEFQQLSNELVQAQLFLDERLLRPVIVTFMTPEMKKDIPEVLNFVQNLLGQYSGCNTAYIESNSDYIKTELNRMRQRVDAVNAFIDSSRTNGDEASAEALLPGLARKKLVMRHLEKQLDQSTIHHMSGIRDYFIISSSDDERPLKRTRPNT